MIVVAKVAMGLCGLLLAVGVVIGLGAVEGTPAPQTPPSVAPRPFNGGR